MAETADILKLAQVRASNKLHHYKKGCDSAQKEREGIMKQLANIGCLENDTKSFSVNISRRASVATQTASLPGVEVPFMHAFMAARQVKELTDKLKPPSKAPTQQRRRIRPRVTISQTSHSDNLPVRKKACQKTISLLHSRAATESWEDGELESQSINRNAVAEDTSEDELAYDTLIPTKPSKTARSSTSSGRPKSSEAKKSAVASKFPSRNVTMPRAPPEHIDWMFWIQVDEIGYWRPFADFPRTVQTLFKSRFRGDFLTRQNHFDHYARMLRNKDRRVSKQMCVNNVTHECRNKSSRWKKTGDQDLTCDLCFNKRRFCARLVMIDCAVKLGFFPLPECDRNGATWKEIQFWIRGEEQKGY